MRELNLMSLHEDGNHVVLKDSEGERYLLRIDEPLRDAVRRDRTFKSKPQPMQPKPIAPGQQFSPREVQDRVRAGHSPEDVAAALGYELQRVLRFAPPIIAERERNAERARRFPAARLGSPALEDVVRDRLTSRGIAEAPTWDAFKTENGWLLQLLFVTPDEHAEALWHVDFEVSGLVPQNEAAAWFSDQSQEAEERMFRRRLAAVRNWVYDESAPTGELAAQAREAEAAPATAPIRVQLPADQAERDGLLADLQAQRGVRPSDPLAGPTDLPSTLPHSLSPRQAAGPDAPATAPGVDPATQLSPAADKPVPAAGTKSTTASLPLQGATRTRAEGLSLADHTDTDTLEQAGQEPGVGGQGGTGASATHTGPQTQRPNTDHVDTQAMPVHASETTNPQRVRRKRPARPSVPSWDEIIFGTKGSAD